ncbi:hypothetical protein [uncultured Algoriphagus sp.]|uniref:hypothetical protein n=1 Tax=uncultured Algoriphagus sp. TaxID=417365 RepID=UPI00258E7049|nr:hypothetical protein [uncultured Algoriphagus sp.]
MNVTTFNTKIQELIAEIPAIKGYARVVDDNQATKKLASRQGIQLVTVLPSYSAEGIAGRKADSWTTLFWVIEKGDPSQSEARELDQYRRCEEAIHQLKDLIIESEENGCSLFWRLEIASIVIEPEYNAFGGWNGYFMTLTF